MTSLHAHVFPSDLLDDARVHAFDEVDKGSESDLNHFCILFRVGNKHQYRVDQIRDFFDF